MAQQTTEEKIKKILNAVVNEVVTEMSKKVSDSYDKLLGIQGEYYDRTGDVSRALKSPTVKMSGGKLFVSLFDQTLIRSAKSTVEGHFNHHMNWDESTTWRGQDLSYLVPIFLDRGFHIHYKDGYGRTQTRTYSGLRYVEKALGIDDLTKLNDYFYEEVLKRAKEQIKMLLKGGD